MIGVGTVIIEDVPDYSIMAGNPARLIKKRTALFIRMTKKRSGVRDVSLKKNQNPAQSALPTTTLASATRMDVS